MVREAGLAVRAWFVARTERGLTVVIMMTDGRSTVRIDIRNGIARRRHGLVVVWDAQMTGIEMTICVRTLRKIAVPSAATK